MRGNQTRKTQNTDTLHAVLPIGFDKGKLKTILFDYFDRIRDKNMIQSTIPYKHTIKLCDNRQVSSKSRTVLYGYQS